MTPGAEAPARDDAERRSTRHLVRAHALWLGVAATIASAAAFLLHQLLAWPPHEDETLALFVGRDSLGGVIAHVTRDRGGAPLHFLLAWAVARLDLGLGGLRTLSAVFALSSLPLVTLLAVRLAGRRAALIATMLVAASWLFLFQGFFGRMYSAFLFLSLASFLALLHALGKGGRTWVLWGAASLLCVAVHPYGALVLAAQGLYVLLAGPDGRRGALGAFTVVVVLGIPFWLTDLVLADRFDVGVGVAAGGEKLGGPRAIATYLWQTAGDFSAGWWPVLLVVLLLVALGLRSVGREARLLCLSVIAVPATAFLVAQLGSSTSPETRHLIFVLPFFATLAGAGIARATRRVPVLAVLAVAGLLVAEIGWAWHRTPVLFEWEPAARQAARAQAESYLASTSRQDDLLFGYDPLFIGAWERNDGFPRMVVPRADARLAMRRLERQPAPLGHGVWILDASDASNPRPRLEIEQADPGPAGVFVTRAFGPFLVIRTARPVVTPSRYLALAARAMRLGRSLGIVDADVNLQTVERAERLQRG
jgi:hypothetical protein